ncbi:IDEAL domain-containing protein [Sporosarcina sp. FSL W7-1349]|uniref:IDEAL domain-containing protein n=1 Tax=Sporosarcina sp. FSL W7-1349 TaxID=2921561 RepID=UPI0030FC1449
MGEEIIRRLMRDAMFAAMHAQQIEVYRAFGHLKVSYFDLEYSPKIQTRLTDMDMLLLRIDMALDAGDKKQFLLLTDQLKEVEHEQS